MSRRYVRPRLASLCAREHSQIIDPAMARTDSAPQRRSPGRDDVEWIVGNEIGPVRRHGAQAAHAVMKPGPVLAPVLPPHDQVEHLTEQRVVRMRHPKRSSLNVSMRRS